MNIIDKNTKIYGSFSSNPGNNGCIYFNRRFAEDGINSIYKSFYSDNIKESVSAAKTLDFKGFAISSPFKIEVLKYVDELDYNTQQIGAANTIVNNNGILKAYNTDYIGVLKYLKNRNIKKLIIVGDGGFSKAVRYACDILNIDTEIINRKNWNKLITLKGIIFNATPIEIHTDQILIDGRPFTEEGKQIALLQAEEQYKIYTNEQY